jgi:hypothetical protein
MHPTPDRQNRLEGVASLNSTGWETPQPSGSCYEPLPSLIFFSDSAFSW